MVRSNLIIGILLLACSVRGQEFLIDSTLKSEYPFVYWENNRLEFYGESRAFQKFFSRLDSLYTGKSAQKLNFLHIGGSHIQADIYSHRLRRYLQDMTPE